MSGWQSTLATERVFGLPLVIGVLADTHVFRQGARRLPREVPALFERLGVGLLLHAGDLNDDRVLLDLQGVAPVIAVQGNNDSAELRSRLRLQESFEAGGHRIGLIHGHGGRTAREVAFAAFADGYDLVVYGHSHIPRIEKRGQTVFFNPGSPTDRRWEPHFGIGVIRCTASCVEPELILFSRASDLDAVGPQGSSKPP